jgi:hypothetical protein
MASTRYAANLSGVTASIAQGAAATLSLTIASGNSNIDIHKISVVPSVVGSGQKTKVAIYKKSTCLDIDRCFATTEFEGSLYAPMYNDGSGATELNEGLVCDYEDSDVTGKLNVKIFNTGPTSKTFTYAITYQDVEPSTSGTYTPTLTNTTNVTGSTPYLWSYVRSGNIVVVYFVVDVDPTAAAPTATELQASLPPAFPSNFSSTIQAYGNGNCANVPAQTSTITSNAANDRVAISFSATSSANATHIGSFAYQVI